MMNIGIGRRGLGCVTLLLATTAACSPAQAQEVLEFTDFRRVAVESGIRIEIRQGNTFLVEANGPPINLDHLRVEQEGDRLRFSMEREGGWLWWLRAGPGGGGRDIEIRIEMPELVGLSLSGGSRGVVRMDRLADSVQGSLSGGSRIEGTLQARSMNWSLSGGSRATLAGRTQELGLSASGGSRLDFAALESGSVRAQMSGGSQLTVTTSGPIDASLSGGSQIRYHGAATLGRISVKGGSRVQAAR